MKSSMTRWLLVLAAALATGGLPRGADTGAVDVAVKGRTNGYASLAANGSFVGLAWGASTEKGVTDIYAAASRDGGRSFGPPVRVNDVAGAASLSGEQPPRIALVPRSGLDASMVVVWTAKSSGGTRVLSARSDDGGRRFSASQSIAGSEAPGNRGWDSIATDREGRVVAVWLDHRELAATGSGTAPQHADHQHASGGGDRSDSVARAQLSKLFFGRVGSPATARPVAAGVCYCCKTTVAVGGSGAIYAAWRHEFAGNVRDVAFTMSADGGRTFAAPVRVSEDNWVLDGCPENGPSLTVDDRGRIHLAWPTLVPGPTPSSEPMLALYLRHVIGRPYLHRPSADPHRRLSASPADRAGGAQRGGCRVGRTGERHESSRPRARDRRRPRHGPIPPTAHRSLGRRRVPGRRQKRRRNDCGLDQGAGRADGHPRGTSPAVRVRGRVR